jgi:SAM-dependent methyltransferase
MAKAKPPKYGLGSRRGPTQHPFDREFGVDTSGLVAGRNLPVGHPHDRYSTAYYGTSPSIFRGLIRRWRQTPPAFPISRYSFIDIGAGKGRALLMASRLPFKQVIGVELHPRLVSTARKNIRIWNEANRGRCPVNIVRADALEFAFPQTPCLVYLFHPFAATLLRKVLKHIEESFPDSVIDFLYVNAEHDSVFAKRYGFTRLWTETFLMTSKDAVAERFIVTEESDGEYGSTGSEICSAWRWSGAK